MQQTYGALPEEWITFDILLGLTEDLLPVVSNPEAVISPASTLRAKGKVPSRYNGSGKLVGIENWTSHVAGGSEVVRWSKEPDYGICVQTRHVRALDIDVTEPRAAEDILRFLADKLLHPLPPIRRRSNSSKCLLGFRLAGEISKRILKVDGGIIEFLANGQQFIAAGTHPSGVRYEWEGLTDFPELTADQFEELWTGLVERFGVEQPHTARARLAGEDTGVQDPVLEQLTVLGWGPQGQAHIECPFKGEHTSDSGESSTSYFPAGTRGYEQGHFVCLHAHCASRSDGEFIEALKLHAADFAGVVDEVPAQDAVPAVWPAFKRDKSGEILPVIDNLYHALRRDDVCESRIAYDSFRDEVVITSARTHALNWRPLADNDYTLLQRHLERGVGFKPITFELLRRTVRMVAHENTFDSAMVWLEGLPAWDGTLRVNSFLARYMGAEDNGYVRAVSRYLWSGLAGRVLSPGVKADMIPILEGKQGTLKSTTVAALAPSPDYFCKISFDEKEDNISRKIRGKLIAEIAELRGLKTKALEAIKDFVSSTHETWVPKWQEHATTFARRLIFIATTNDKEILDDATGNRRWLPLHVGGADIEAIVRDRDQLWAEGRELFLKHGVCYKEAEMLAPGYHEDYTISHPWEGIVMGWLESVDDLGGERPGAKGYVTMGEIMQHALHLDTRNMKGSDAKEVAKILRAHGYERVKKWVGTRAEWVWRESVEI